MLGYTVDEMAGKKTSDFLAPDQEELAARTRRELQAGAKTQPEFKFRRNIRPRSSGDFQCLPGFRPGGASAAHISLLTDITERKHAEEEIERSRRWLERIAGTAPWDIIFVLDIVNHRNVYTNKSVVDLLGYAPEGFGGIQDILEKRSEPEDRERVMEFYLGMADARRRFACSPFVPSTGTVVVPSGGKPGLHRSPGRRSRRGHRHQSRRHGSHEGA